MQITRNHGSCRPGPCRMTRPKCQGKNTRHVAHQCARKLLHLASKTPLNSLLLRYFSYLIVIQSPSYSTMWANYPIVGLVWTFWKQRNYSKRFHASLRRQFVVVVWRTTYHLSACRSCSKMFFLEQPIILLHHLWHCRFCCRRSWALH